MNINTVIVREKPSEEDVLSAILYPEVFNQYLADHTKYGPVTTLDSPTYFQGMRLGETIHVAVRPGIMYIMRLDAVGEPDANGLRTLYFTINGQKQETQVQDAKSQHSTSAHQLAEPTNKNQIGAPMGGRIVSIAVESGQTVHEGLYQVCCCSC